LFRTYIVEVSFNNLYSNWVEFSANLMRIYYTHFKAWLWCTTRKM